MPVLTKKTTAVKHPLKFMDIYADIAMELPQQPNLAIVRAEINKVIRRVNDEIGLWREMVRVSAGSITTGWEDLDTANWNAEATQDWDLWGKFTQGWDWDDGDNILRLSDTVVEVDEVYVDDEIWEPVTYEEVKDTNNSSEKIFCQIGRYLYFPLNLATTTDICDIRVKMNYSFVESAIIDSTVIDLPESYRQLLISGCLFSLSNRGKYKDDDIFKLNKEIFEREHSSLRVQYDNLEVEYVSREPQYKY
jgi:hypothetical protein